MNLKRENDTFQKKIKKYEITDHHYFEMVKAILPQVNNINEISIGGNNLLHYACESENLELVKYILSFNKFDINCKTQVEMKTPIYIAVEKENIMIIKLLLEFPEIDLNIPSIKKVDNEEEIRTVLYLAIEKENYEIIDLLLAFQNINVNVGFKRLLYLDEKKIFYVKTKSPLYSAIKNNRIEAIQRLLNFDDIEPNIGSFLNIRKRIFVFPIHKERSKTPLYLAVKMQNIKIIQLLLECKGIDVNRSIIDINGILRKKETYSIGKKYRNDLEKWQVLLQLNDDFNLSILNIFIQNFLLYFKKYI